MRAVGYSILVLLAAACVWTQVADASWSYDPEENNLLCTASGDQSSVQVVGDDAGGLIAVWVDERDGDSDIYAQRVDVSGVAMWTPADGVAVCSADGAQDSPQVVSDGAGGAIAVWRDLRSGAGADVYAQRIDDLGSTVWTADGVAVCAEAGDQDAAVLTSDGAGGAYIAWEDHRTDPAAEDAYAQLIDSVGDAEWPAGGIVLSDFEESQKSIAVAPDGAGGAVFIWMDDRLTGGGIHGARLDAGGTAVWSSTTTLIDGGAMYWSYPVVMSDGWGGVFITCEGMMGSGDRDILGQRVNASGDPLWGTDGAVLCSAAGDQRGVQLVSDDAGGIIAAWRDEGTGISSASILRFDGWGAPQWPLHPFGVMVSSGLEDAGTPSLAADGAGGAVVAWHGGHEGYEDIFAQRVNATGIVMWTIGGETVSSAFGQKLDPQAVSDGAGGGLIAWSDSRGADLDLYAQRVERNGYLGYPCPEITTVRDYPDDQGGEVIASWTPSYLDEWPLDDVDYYSVWRRLGSDARRGSVPRRVLPVEGSPVREILERDGWDYVGQVQSYQLPEYSMVVPTYGDSSVFGADSTDVMVLAHNYMPEDSWASEVKSGRSIDNLAPGRPDSLIATVVGPDVVLMWLPSGYHDEDLSHYDVHRSDTHGFLPDETTLLSTSPEATFTDVAPGGWTWYYRVIAEDVNGNESPPSNEASATPATGVEDFELPAALRILGTAPNPFALGTEIAFELPSACSARLSVYSADGRLVTTLRSRDMPSGRHSAFWDGMDSSGRELPSGIYFARLVAGEETAVHKMVMLK